MRKPALSGVISSLMLMGTVGLLALRFVLYRRDERDNRRGLASSSHLRASSCRASP